MHKLTRQRVNKTTVRGLRGNGLWALIWLSLVRMCGGIQHVIPTEPHVYTELSLNENLHITAVPVWVWVRTMLDIKQHHHHHHPWAVDTLLQNDRAKHVNYTAKLIKHQINCRANNSVYKTLISVVIIYTLYCIKLKDCKIIGQG